ncbi:biotin/lipoyl-containing protein, partial [Acinetobacter baumannii]
RNVTITAPVHIAPAAAPIMAAPAAVAAPSAGAPAPATDAGAVDYAKHPGVVKSPMVGTAYRAPEPGAPTFVSVGDKVREGQTLLII